MYMHAYHMLKRQIGECRHLLKKILKLDFLNTKKLDEKGAFSVKRKCFTLTDIWRLTEL